MPQSEPGGAPGAADGLQCLHEDSHLLVLAKPPGLLCVPGRGPDKQDCLSGRAQAQWPDALVVHRLDQATSGLVLMARSAQVQRSLGRAFELRHRQHPCPVDAPATRHHLGPGCGSGASAARGGLAPQRGLSGFGRQRPARLHRLQHTAGVQRLGPGGRQKGGEKP